MKELLQALGGVSDRLNGSLDALTELQEIRNCISVDIHPILRDAPAGQNMFLLAGSMDSLKCLIDGEIEETRRLLVSWQKAKKLVENEAYEPTLAHRLQELAHVDAAVQDGDISRHVAGITPPGLSFTINQSTFAFDDVGDWAFWSKVLENHAQTLEAAAAQFPSAHPFSPMFGMIVNLLHSTHQWCEEQRKLQVAIEVISAPCVNMGADYGAFLRLELIELRRQVANPPVGEEE